MEQIMLLEKGIDGAFAGLSTHLAAERATVTSALRSCCHKDYADQFQRDYSMTVVQTRNTRYQQQQEVRPPNSPIVSSSPSVPLLAHPSTDAYDALCNTFCLTRHPKWGQCVEGLSQQHQSLVRQLVQRAGALCTAGRSGGSTITLTKASCINCDNAELLNCENKHDASTVGALDRCLHRAVCFRRRVEDVHQAVLSDSLPHTLPGGDDAITIRAAGSESTCEQSSPMHCGQPQTRKELVPYDDVHPDVYGVVLAYIDRFRGIFEGYFLQLSASGSKRLELATKVSLHVPDTYCSSLLSATPLSLSTQSPFVHALLIELYHSFGKNITNVIRYLRDVQLCRLEHHAHATYNRTYRHAPTTPSTEVAQHHILRNIGLVHAQHMMSAFDLLTDLFEGRKAELAAALMSGWPDRMLPETQSNPALQCNSVLNASDFDACQAQIGGALCTYFTHKISSVTQWLQPRCWK